MTNKDGGFLVKHLTLERMRIGSTDPVAKLNFRDRWDWQSEEECYYSPQVR